MQLQYSGREIILVEIQSNICNYELQYYGLFTLTHMHAHMCVSVNSPLNWWEQNFIEITIDQCYRNISASLSLSFDDSLKFNNNHNFN